MPKVTLNKPKIVAPKTLTEYETADILSIIGGDYDDIYGKNFDGGSCEYVRIESGNIDVSVMQNIKILSCEATFVNFTDMLFDNCDFSNTNFQHCSFHRTLLKNCKLTGTTFNKTSFTETRFDCCIGQLTSFNEGKLKQCFFENCEMISLSFFECPLKDFQISNNNFCKIEINKTFFKGVDFTSSNINGATLLPDSLKGAKISKLQALAIAEMFGMEIE